MSFIDVEAEEEGSLNQPDDSGSSSDADTSLSGFICEDSDADLPTGQLTSPINNVAREDPWSNNVEAHAQVLRAASGSLKRSILFDPDESAESVDSGEHSSASDSFGPGECDAPQQFLGSNGLPDLDQREVQIDDTLLELPSYTDSISVILPDGLCADMEVEPYEIWRKSSARAATHPCMAPTAQAKRPADWFDELRLCKDRRGAYGVRSSRKVIAGKSKIRFPSGHHIEVPTKRIVVEHTFFPYDPATWEQPANYRVPQSVPMESSDEDLVELADKADIIGRLSSEVATPDRSGEDSSSSERKKPRLSVDPESTVRVDSDNSRNAKKKTVAESPAHSNSEKEAETATAGYILSESQSEAEQVDVTAQPARARLSSSASKSKNVNRHQDVLQRPVARIKAHTTALQTTKQKKRRQRRLEMMRLKRDLLEENADLGQLWSLSERRTKRQARNDHARKMTTAHTLEEVRGAAYNFLLPG